MLSAIRLPISFDPDALARETETFDAAMWIAHFNTAQYEGDWSGLALRSIGGVQTQLYPDPTVSDAFAPTPALRGSDVFGRALAAFQCEVLSARLLRLGPGSRIGEHRDYRLGHDDGEVRVHVPITTNPKVEFRLDGHVIEMGRGEVWYLDLNLPHSVSNDGGEDRVHLVVDCVVDDWLTEQLLAGDPGGNISSATGRCLPSR